jgi:CRP-like cAMP-binding protein
MGRHDILLLKLFRVLDSYRPQSERFYKHISETVHGKYYAADEILYQQGQVIKDVYFLASGNMITYRYTDSGDKQLLNIYQANEIVFASSFTLQKKSRYNVMVCADAYLLSVDHKQMREIYKRFPEVEELARMIISDRESKELKRNEMLIEPGIQMVEEFYKNYPELLEPGKVLRDSDIASYLLLAEGTLRTLRNRLLHTGHLRIHDQLH